MDPNNQEPNIDSGVAPEPQPSQEVQPNDTFGQNSSTENTQFSQSPQVNQLSSEGSPGVIGGQPQQPQQQSQPSFKKPNKTVIIGIIAGAGALIVVTALVIFFTSFFSTLTNDDYLEASEQYNNLSLASREANTAASSLVRSSSDSDDARFESNVEDLKSAVAKLKEESDKLGETKVARVGDGATAYKNLNNKIEAYTEYADSIIVSFEKMRPAMLKCGGVNKSSDQSARVIAMRECSNELKKANGVPVGPLDTYLATLSSKFSEYADTQEAIAKLEKPFGADYEQYKVLRDKATATQREIQDASKKMSTDMKAEDEKASPKEESKVFIDYIREQLDKK